MTKTISIQYPGELRTIALHLQSGTEIITDAPTDNNGKGQSFSPTDLLAAALGTCMITIMGIAAQKNNVNIDGIKAEVTKIMASNPRRVSEVVVKIFSLNDYSEEIKKILITAALNCPVANSIHPEIVQNIKFVWGN